MDSDTAMFRLFSASKLRSMELFQQQTMLQILDTFHGYKRYVRIHMYHMGSDNRKELFRFHFKDISTNVPGTCYRVTDIFLMSKADFENRFQFLSYYDFLYEVFYETLKKHTSGRVRVQIDTIFARLNEPDTLDLVSSLSRTIH